MSRLRVELGEAWDAVSGRAVIPGDLVAEHVGGRSWLRVAKSSDGLAVVVPGQDQRALPDYALEHLRARFNLRCSIEADGVRQVENLSIVECIGNDARLTQIFLDVAAAVLPLDDRPSPGELHDSVSGLAELFKAVLTPGAKSTLGLWGELFALSQSDDPAFAASSWHVSPHDRYDFAADNVRVEVKTSTDYRAHHFSLEQLRPPAGITVVIASIVTTASPAGPSIQELVDELAGVTRGQTRTHLISTAMSSLGSGWRSGAGTRFDADLARSTMRFFNADEVPRVADPPLDVRGVKFVADLSNTTDMAINQVAATGRLGAAFVSS